MATLNKKEIAQLERAEKLLNKIHDRICEQDGIDHENERYDGPAWDAAVGSMGISELLDSARARDYRLQQERRDRAARAFLDAFLRGDVGISIG